MFCCMYVVKVVGNIEIVGVIVLVGVNSTIITVLIVWIVSIIMAFV